MSAAIDMNRVDSAVPAPSDSKTAEEDTNRELKIIRRKVDRRLIAFYAVTFLFLKVSERNIVNAAILNIESGKGVKEQLGISESQWAWVLSSFTYGFLIFEFWSTFLFKYFGPRKFVVRLLLTWGIVAMTHSAAQNFAGLTACRVLLGMCEAGFMPGAIYHFTFWYPINKLVFRYSFIFACMACSGILASCLGWAIAHMNGMAGLPGFRWLFILEGSPAILCGVAAFFLMPTFPSKAKFLTDREKELLAQSLSDSQPKESAKAFDREELKTMFRDSTFYLWSIIFTCQAVGGFSVGTILSTIILELGLKGSTTTQLLSMPGFVLVAALEVTLSWLVLRKKINAWFTCICFNFLVLACYVVLLTVERPIVKYLAIELGLSAAVCIFPLLWPERVKCARGTSAAGLAISISTTCVHLTGLLGPHIYGHRFAPNYRTSFLVTTALISTSTIFIIVTWRIVRKRDIQEKQSIQDLEL